MAVAPSFQNFEMLCEPYEVNGKKYIRVRNPKTGTERQVRWYEDKPAATQTATKMSAQDVYNKPQKEVLGFDKGYITIFKGETYPHLEWFRESAARYHNLWGWYIVSTDEVPADLPEDITPVRLFWELVGNDEGFLFSEAKIKEGVESLIYEAGSSEYVGEIGDKIEVSVVVVKQIKLESAYGITNMHIFEDDCGNQYVWTTNARDWAEGSRKKIRGTVREHKTFRNIKQTVLTRCTERV